jgi:hypothetical protein
MMKYLMRMGLIVSLAALVALPLAAQNNNVITDGAKGGLASSDSNVKSSNMTNSMDQNIVPPASKGGPKAKGVDCEIHVDNHTPYYIQFYVNGEAGGVIGPWGDLYPDITGGYAQLYARAVFNDGSIIRFGPRDLQCTGTDYVWTLK